MKEILKGFAIQLPTIIVVIILLWMFKGNQLTYQDVMNQINQKDSIISKVIDDQGRLVQENVNRQYSPYVIQNSNSAEMVELRSELKGLGIALKDLKSAVNISMSTSGKGETQIVRIVDTLKNETIYAFTDTTGKHLSLKGTINIDSSKIDYTYTYSANYKLFSYEYKKKFFGRPELRLKLISDDPSNDVKMQTFTVKPPKEIISIGVGLGAAFYYADGKVGIAPAISIGLYKPIYTFRTKN